MAQLQLPQAAGTAGEEESHCANAYIKRLMKSQTHH